MINTTPQNISKYEKEGIHDIDIIRYLSDALGHNLMTDEVDEEGTVGEIGKEILSILVESKVPFSDKSGSVTALDLLDGEWLFGLSEERITKELFKLEKIGLCVREQYIDFYGKEHDDIFITAKGVITLKHIGGFKNELGDYRNVNTYEMICEEFESYQAYIDSEPVEKIIRSLTIQNGFRINYIWFLMKEYNIQNDFLGYFEKYYLGKSAYVDIIFSMIMEITREKSDYMFKKFNENFSEEVEIEFDELCELLYPDRQYNNLVNELKKYISDDMPYNCVDWDAWVEEKNNVIGISDEYEKKYDRYLKIIHNDEELENMVENADTYLADMFNTKLKKYGYKNPLNWYSKEEIEIFIKSNILEAGSKYEKYIENKLKRINEMEPNLVAEYFKFPLEWEENGLANLVRELYKVKDVL